MTQPLTSPLLAIDLTRWDDFSSGLKPQPMATNDLLFVLMLLPFIGLAVWVVLRLLAPRDKEKRYSSPLRMFLGLCSAHKLRLHEGWLLWQVAVARREHHPARIFLEPDWFMAEGLPDKLKPKAYILLSLKQRLFAQPGAAGQSQTTPPVPPTPAATDSIESTAVGGEPHSDRLG